MEQSMPAFTKHDPVYVRALRAQTSKLPYRAAAVVPCKGVGPMSPHTHTWGRTSSGTASTPSHSGVAYSL